MGHYSTNHNDDSIIQLHTMQNNYNYMYYVLLHPLIPKKECTHNYISYILFNIIYIITFVDVNHRSTRHLLWPMIAFPWVH